MSQKSNKKKKEYDAMLRRVGIRNPHLREELWKRNLARSKATRKPVRFRSSQDEDCVEIAYRPDCEESEI